MDDAALAGPGHNSLSAETTTTIGTPPDADLIQEQLGLTYATYVSRRDDLLAGVLRLIGAHGTLAFPPEEALPTGEKRGDIAMLAVDGKRIAHRWNASKWEIIPAIDAIRILLPTIVIPDETVAQRVTSFVKQLKENAKLVEADRVKEKSPWDAVADQIQAFFKSGLKDPLDGAAQLLEKGPLTDFQRRKRAEETERRRQEAETARAEANRIAAIAERTGSPDIMDTAIDLAEDAERKQEKAAAPTADLARVSGSQGGVAAALTEWKYRIVDRSKIPQRFWVLDERAIAAEVKRLKDKADIDGIEVYDDIKASVR